MRCVCLSESMARFLRVGKGGVHSIFQFELVEPLDFAYGVHCSETVQREHLTGSTLRRE